MPDHNSSPSGSLNRHIAPSVIVILFALVMSACVLGIVIWKALDAKATTLERGQTATQNLAHSLIEHAAHTIQAADITMTGIVEFLKYQTPVTERFNRYLASTDQAMLVGDADLALYEAKRLGRNRSFAASALKHAYVESGPLQPDAELRTGAGQDGFERGRTGSAGIQS